MLYYIIYFSKSANLMQDEDLQHLLKQSRSWNTQHGLTGMLLYIEGQFTGTPRGSFMQVLEGTKLEVEYMFSLIKQDERHHNITVLQQGELKKRDFPDWQMGFEKINMEDGKLPDGLFKLDDTFLKSRTLKQTNMATTFLKMFYQMKKA
jgi:hypothetical protein